MTMRTIWVKFKTVTSMKKIFTKAMLVAAAAMAFFACQKQEINSLEEVKVEGLNFSAEKPEFADASKTEWTGSEIHWSKGDAIRVAYTCNGVWQDASGNPEQGKYGKLYASDPLSETIDVATFVVPGTFKGSEQGDYKFYGIYPSTLTSSTDLSSAPSVSIDIPSEQTPAANSFDAKADVMVAQSDIYNGMPKNGEKNGSISLKWNRLVAHGHITLKSLPVDGQEVVKSIVLTADAEADMVGKHKVNFNTQEVEKDGSNATNSIAINGTNLTIDANGNVTFWASFLPCTWKSISVSVETDKATYTLERNLVELDKTKIFAKNARNVLAINMAEANRAGKVVVDSDYSGTYVILAQRGSNYYYLTGVETTTSTPRLTAVDAGTTLPEAGLETEPSKVWNLVKTNGKYLLQSAQGEYVAYTKNGDNSADMASEGVVFDVVKNEDTYQFTLTDKNGEKRFLSLNENTGNDYFAMYKSGQKMDLCLIPAEVGEVPPVINATAPEEMAAAGGEGSFNFTLANPQDGQSVSAESNVDWITGESVSGNTVTYTVAVNTSEEPREGTITLSYEGAEDVKVVIAQAGKAPEISDQEEAQETLTFSDRYSANTVLKDVSVQATNFNVSFAGAGTSAQYYTNGTSVRAYAKNTFTVSSDKTIAKVEITFGTGDGSNAITTDVGNYQNGTWIGSAKSVTFTVGGTSGHRRIAAITVHYTDSTSGETPKPEQPTLTPRNLTFSETTATATLGQAFTAPTLSGVTTGVTYSSSNTAVATVDASTGDVTLVSAGTTTITASAPATTQYEAGDATYTLTVNPAQGVQQTTTTYTFNSKSWGDSTQSWTSGKDGAQYTSGQGVQVTSTYTGANATCKTTLSNVSSVEVSYCTNKSSGNGSITIAIGSVTKTVDVAKSGSDGRTLKTITLDFSSELPSGTPKITVACSANSVYINALTFTHTN